MSKRWFSCLPVLVLLAAPAAAVRADQPKQDSPSLVVRLRSLDATVEAVRLVFNPLLKQDVAGMLDDFVKSKLGPDGLKGIDAKRPIGLYGKVTADLAKLNGVLLLPVSDEKDFLTTLDNLNFKAEKDATGLYTIKQNVLPTDVYFRFANQYAYLSLGNAEAVDANRLVHPRDLFLREMTGVLSVSLLLENVPEADRDKLRQKLDQKLADMLAKQVGGESKAQEAFRFALVREVQKQLTAAIKDGKELSIDLDVNRQTEQLTVDLKLTARSDTDLAKTIAGISAAKSQFGGLLHRDAAMNVLVNVQLPEKLREALNRVIEEGGKKAIEETREDAKKGQVTRLLKALMPSLQGGELDAAISLRGPSIEKTYTLVAGVKLREVGELTKTLFALLKELPATEQKLLKLNADKEGTVAIHRLEINKSFDPATKAAFGDNPLYFAFREDAIFVALGDDGLAALKGRCGAGRGGAAVAIRDVARPHGAGVRQNGRRQEAGGSAAARGQERSAARDAGGRRGAAGAPGTAPVGAANVCPAGRRGARREGREEG